MTDDDLIALVRRLVAATELHKARKAHKPSKKAMQALKEATHAVLRLK